MASQRLHNHLCAHRKRAALSQDEVAFLLGVVSSAKVSRYEQFARMPGLESALAYEAIFQKPISELFPRLSLKIQVQVESRAKQLAKRVAAMKPNDSSLRKTKTLELISLGRSRRHSKRS